MLATASFTAQSYTHPVTPQSRRSPVGLCGAASGEEPPTHPRNAPVSRPPWPPFHHYANEVM